MRALTKSAARVVTLAAAGGLFLGAAGIANAAYNPSSPPYPADPNNQASITIFDAATGAVVTNGSTSTPLSNLYFVSSSNFAPGHTRAAIFGYLAETGKAPGVFSGQSLGPSTVYPATSAPAPVNSVSTPVARGGSGTFDDLATTYPNSAPSSSDFYQLYQLRVFTTVPAPQSTSYAYADIAIDPTAHTWRQLAPTTSTAPLPPAAPGKPTATAGDASATVTVPATSGASSFTITSSPGGFTQTGAGPDFSFTGLTNGTPYTFTATATNANGTSAASPASDPVTPQKVGPASATALAVTPPASGYDDAPYVLTATVTSPGNASQVDNGNVAFYDNGSATPIAGTITHTTGGTYSLSALFTAGGHSVVAKFTSADTTLIGSSQSAAAPFTAVDKPAGGCAQPGAVCTDPQDVVVDVPVGTLVINTPYTSASPLVMPTMALNTAGDRFTSSKTFDNIKVTDTRSGDLPWTAKVLSGDFAQGSIDKINSQNVGLTALALDSNSGLGVVSFSDNAASSPPLASGATGSAGIGGATAHTFAADTKGPGTVVLHGTLTINAPTSVKAGTYRGTIVFTVG